MQITFYCSKCQAKLKNDAGAAGTSLDCPRCGESLTVPKAALGPGTVIGGFQIKELLGKGAMGVVYLAQQLSLNRLVALKILSHDLYQDKEQVARFLREVRVLAQLDHPNIVAAHEAGQDAGLLFLAMGYVKGMTLAEKVKLKGKINWKETCRLAKKLADALAYAWNDFRVTTQVASRRGRLPELIGASQSPLNAG